MRQPKVTEVSELTLKVLESLVDGDAYTIEHMNLYDVFLKIEKAHFGDVVLNTPIVFYNTSKYVISDSTSVFDTQKVELEAEEMVAYVGELLNCRSMAEFKYCKKLKEKGLRIGDIIQFSDGKRGVVSRQTVEQGSIPNIRYIPLTQKGTVSKVKPRILYGGVEFIKTGGRIDTKEMQ
jgi:hypothetical protein